MLGAASGITCAILMAIVLAVYGTPCNGLWWFVMLAILIAAFVAPRLIAYPLEWVFEGYRED